MREEEAERRETDRKFALAVEEQMKSVIFGIEDVRSYASDLAVNVSRDASVREKDNQRAYIDALQADVIRLTAEHVAFSEAVKRHEDKEKDLLCKLAEMHDHMNENTVVKDEEQRHVGMLTHELTRLSTENMALQAAMQQQLKEHTQSLQQETDARAILYLEMERMEKSTQNEIECARKLYDSEVAQHKKCQTARLHAEERLDHFRGHAEMLRLQLSSMQEELKEFVGLERLSRESCHCVKPPIGLLSSPVRSSPANVLSSAGWHANGANENSVRQDHLLRLLSQVLNLGKEVASKPLLLTDSSALHRSSGFNAGISLHRLQHQLEEANDARKTLFETVQLQSEEILYLHHRLVCEDRLPLPDMKKSSAGSEQDPELIQEFLKDLSKVRAELEKSLIAREDLLNTVQMQDEEILRLKAGLEKSLIARDDLLKTVQMQDEEILRLKAELDYVSSQYTREMELCHQCNQRLIQLESDLERMKTATESALEHSLHTILLTQQILQEAESSISATLVQKEHFEAESRRLLLELECFQATMQEKDTLILKQVFRIS